MEDSCSLKQEIKLDLIDYYDDIKIRIDIEAQTKLIKIQKGEIDDKNKQKILNLNQKLIEISNDLFNMNCNQVDEYFNNKSNENNQNLKTKLEIKKKCIKNYCFFSENSLLNTEFKNENQIGLFISSDWYLDENQINFMKVRTQNKISDIKFLCDEDIMNLIYGFDLIEDGDLEPINVLPRNSFKNVYFFEKDMIINHISNLEKKRIDLVYQGENGKDISPFKIENSFFKNYKNLKSLDLICNKSLIETGIFSEFSDKNLQELSINSEIKQNVDSSFFTGLNQLIRLSLFNCQITKINQDAFNKLECLIKLDLSWNNLETTSMAIFNELINLKCLVLSRCNLNSIDNINLNKLEDLNLKINQLKTVKSTWFCELKNLKILNLSKCHISLIEKNSFINLYCLEELDLSENNITIISHSMLNGLNSLRVLDLKLCEIISIEDGSFNSFTNLEELYLNKNKIEKLNKKTFDGLINLKHLDLRGNIFNINNQELFANLKNLESLFLGDINFSPNIKKIKKSK